MKQALFRLSLCGLVLIGSAEDMQSASFDVDLTLQRIDDVKGSLWWDASEKKNISELKKDLEESRKELQIERVLDIEREIAIKEGFADILFCEALLACYPANNAKAVPSWEAAEKILEAAEQGSKDALGVLDAVCFGDADSYIARYSRDYICQLILERIRSKLGKVHK